MLDKILNGNRLFKILRDKVIASECYAPALDKKMFSFINEYIEFHKLSDQDVKDFYLKYIRAYNNDARAFLKTGKYPLQIDADVKALDRIPYNIVLLLSTILTPHRFRIMQLIDETKPMEGNALFIGCGPGLEMKLTSEKYNHVVAYDLTVDEHLKTAFKDIEIRNEFFDGQLDEKFKAVYLIEILEHLKEPYKLLENCASVLETGGAIYLTTATDIPQFDHLYNFEADHINFENAIKKMQFEIKYSEKITHPSLTLAINSFNKYYHIVKK